MGCGKAQKHQLTPEFRSPAEIFSNQVRWKAGKKKIGEKKGQREKKEPIMSYIKTNI